MAKDDGKKKEAGLHLDDGVYQSPRWSYELLDCSMPMSFDTYSNCAHQCLYCFSFFQRAIGLVADDYLHHKVRAVDVERVMRMFTDPKKYGGQFAQYIMKRMVLQWGGLSDGFDFYERKFGASLQLLNFFNSIDYPISISTKGVWWTDDPRYQDAVRDQKNQHWKFSIITANEDHVKKLEPGVPPSKKRFEAMYKLNKLGVGATTLRFRPFVLGTSDKCIEQMMQMAEDAGCYSVTTEFLTWESRASNTSKSRLQAMSDVLGYDVWDFYVKNSNRTAGLLRLNYDIKRPYMLEMQEAAEKHNLKFFVSDAHHKELSYHAGCCGLPEAGPLSVTNKGQYAEAILIAKKNGFVQWKDIAHYAEEIFADTPFFRAEGFPNSSEERAKHRYHNMAEYMHDMWNTPNSYMSPNRYFGGALVAGDIDEHGDIIYLYNKPFIDSNIRVETVSELAYELRMAGKPNAERFDEMSADGTPFGYVAYPVFVISRKRWSTATTMRLLDSARVNYTLVVPEADSGYYMDKFPNADMAIMPKGKEEGAGTARAFVYDYAKEEGYGSYVWILDDDIMKIEKVADSEPVNLREAMSDVEKWLNDYSNVAMVGLNDKWDTISKPFTLNGPVQGMMLVNLMTGLGGFSALYKVYEDIEFALRHLANGWVTAVYNKYKVSYTDFSGGGASGMFIDNTDAYSIAATYPECVSLEYEQGVPYPLIEWSYYSSVIKSRQVELLMKGE